ncbi:MAG: TatD family hydrolase [Eubacteriales bacterium]|nr:TatD family hydrolase [Eubacteriales bacterium]
MLFDSHSHFNNEDLTSLERQALFSVVDTAVSEGRMSYAVDIGFDPESSKMAAEHAAVWPWCYAAVGCHPHDTKDMDDMKLALIKGLAANDKVVAIGEIGLDFHYDLSDRAVQREWFRKQIRLANELKMPIVIHAREADQEVMDILKEEGTFSEERKSWFARRPGGSWNDAGFASSAATEPDARVLLHCFSGSAELGKQYVKLGATISVAGPVTYKNNRKTVAMVEAIPLEYLLVETDSPYLAPVPHRGRRNIPLFVEFTARKVAEIKGISFEEAAKATKDNAMRFYGIR